MKIVTSGTAPLKKVIATQDTWCRYNATGAGRRWFKLECGHVVTEKQSGGNPSKKRCRECHYGNPPSEHDKMPNEL